MGFNIEVLFRNDFVDVLHINVLVASIYYYPDQFFFFEVGCNGIVNNPGRVSEEHCQVGLSCPVERAAFAIANSDPLE